MTKCFDMHLSVLGCVTLYVWRITLNNLDIATLTHYALGGLNVLVPAHVVYFSFHFH